MWEYLTVELWWDSEDETWNAECKGKKIPPGDNPGELLNPFGEEGWEVMSFTPKVYEESMWYEWKTPDDELVDRVVAGWGVQVYVALLKRRKP